MSWKTSSIPGVEHPGYGTPPTMIPSEEETLILSSANVDGLSEHHRAEFEKEIAELERKIAELKAKIPPKG
jgi:hypothetical protein